jgi:hypothetical protein
MAELILNNLPIVLFVVITIAVRVLQARAKARRKEAPPVFATDLEPDEEEAGYRPRRDEAEALIDYARTRGASAAMVEKAHALMAGTERPRIKITPGLSVDEGPAFYPLTDPEPAVPAAENLSPPSERIKKPAASMPERRKRGGGFFPPLEQFTPPQQAVVWAEVLGKPKGME